MRTLDNQSPTRTASRLSRFLRDLRLARRLLSMTFYYLGEGRRIRKAYQDCASRGQTYWLDAPGSPGDEAVIEDAPEWRSS